MKPLLSGKYSRKKFYSSSRPTVPIYVIGNRITTQIFPGTKVTFSINFHSKTLIQFIIEMHRGEEVPSAPPNDVERRWFCLEQLLNRMLRERHEKQTSLPAPHPTIATMGMTRKERTAVTKPYNRTRIMKMNKRGSYHTFSSKLNQTFSTVDTTNYRSCKALRVDEKN